MRATAIAILCLAAVASISDASNPPECSSYRSASSSACYDRDVLADYDADRVYCCSDSSLRPGGGYRVQIHGQHFECFCYTQEEYCQKFWCPKKWFSTK